MKDRRRNARRRFAKNNGYIHNGKYVEEYKTIVYPTYSTLYMSGFDTPEEFSNYICEKLEKKYDWAIKKHGTALKALFHQDKDTTQTFEIDKIFACFQFDNTPEHQVANWHQLNTQGLTKSENQSKPRPTERSEDFFKHIEDINDWYRNNEEQAFKVVTSNIFSLDKVMNVLKSDAPETSHVPESCNRSAWIDWYDGLDPNKNDYRKKVEKLEKGSKTWLHSYITQVNDYY